MTPAIDLLVRGGHAHTVHEYSHDRGAASFGEEAAQKLGVDPQQVFKTLVASGPDRKLTVGIVPVSARLGLKKLAKAVGARKLEMANPGDIERKTGYVLGGVSPLGQKNRLPTLLDQSAEDFSTIFVSAGRRGLEIELAPALLIELTAGNLADIRS